MSKALELHADSITKSFSQLLVELNTKVREAGHTQPVDIQVDFKSVSMHKGGFLWRRNRTDSTMHIKLATRILPGEV
jgi:hypothetical protein